MEQKTMDAAGTGVLYRVVYAFDREEVVVTQMKTCEREMGTICQAALDVVAGEAGAKDLNTLIAFSILKVEAEHEDKQ